MYFHERPRGASLRPLQAGLQRPRGILPGIPAPCSPAYRLPLDFPSHLLSLKSADMTPDNRRESLRLALRPIRSRRGPATERGTFPRLFSPPVFFSLFLLFFFSLPLNLQTLLVQSNSYPLHILSLLFPFPFSLLPRIASSLAFLSFGSDRKTRPAASRASRRRRRPSPRDLMRAKRPGSMTYASKQRPMSRRPLAVERSCGRVGALGSFGLVLLFTRPLDFLVL